MMKIQKKYIYLTFVFLFISAIIYLIIISYFTSNLLFKNFYTLQNTTQNIQHDKQSYIIDENNEIIYLEKNGNLFSIYSIDQENIEPKKKTSFELENVVDYTFTKHSDYLYLFYNSYSNLVIINNNTNVNKHYQDIEKGQYIFDDYNNLVYLLNDYNLYSVNFLEDGISTNLINNLPSDIKQIKTVSYVKDNKLSITTYNSELFIYDLTSKKNYKSNHSYHMAYTHENATYYTYSYDDSKIGIGIIKNGQETNFSINYVDYLSMRVVEDYIYLINEKYIYKVSISRQKRHETLEISEYVNSTFSLLNVIIINEKLMYLPMIAYIQEGETSYYKYCLYKYEV